MGVDISSYALYIPCMYKWVNMGVKKTYMMWWKMGPLSNSQAAQSNSEPALNAYHWPALLRATLEEGPRSRVQWNKAILLDESHKLDPWPLKEDPWPKIGKLRLNLHGTILEGKSIGLDPKKKKRTSKESSWFGEPRCKQAARIQLKDSICFKWVQIGS